MPMEFLVRTAMAWTLGEAARNHSVTWTCLRKVAYATFEEASAHVRSIEGSYGWDGDPLTQYKCDRCGQWHVGREPWRRRT